MTNRTQPMHIIPSIKELKNLSYALKLDVTYIYLSDIHIGNLKNMVDLCHKAGKKVIVNMDLVAGLHADGVGIKLLKQQFKVDIAIGRGVSKINMAKSSGLQTIQRVILEDTIALTTSIKMLSESKADMIELRPGFYGMKFLKTFKEKRDLPFILSGFVDNKDMLEEARDHGFFGVTTSFKELWDVKV
ncbi:glycerol-3-phosphate responsive antiterminator [Oceanobacillus kapialis]|uniref:Glycerol uptake operon antiterminator regulatory protein n=1 Tax=Oceanobacillus kapialis TaxID=481353 RepID=A0ABW5Q3B7_9BACI